MPEYNDKPAASTFRPEKLSTLKTEAASSSKMLATFYRTKRSLGKIHGSGNIQSHIMNLHLRYEVAVHLKFHTWIISKYITDTTPQLRRLSTGSSQQSLCSGSGDSSEIGGE
jgi:hypothetical protein